LASFAIRLLPSGGLLVAAGCTVQRFDPNGCLVQVYGADGAYHDYFSLALTADGQSFWVGDLSASNRFEIRSLYGALLTAPLAAGGAGLSVYGASTPVPAPCLAAGTLDAGFDPGAGSGQYSTVYGIARQCDGKFLIASEGSTPLLRLKPDGSQDTSFAPNIDNTVFAVIVQPDGKILIAGKFHQVNSQNNSYGLARLNSDGSSDLTFHTGQQLAGYYRAMALQSDGKILASHSVLGIKR